MLNIANADTLPIIDQKYLNLIDKNGHITDLKEFNKNGKIIVFKNRDKKPNGYIFIILMYDNHFQRYTIDGDYGKNYNSFVENFYEEGSVGYSFYFEAKLDLDNFLYYDIIDDEDLYNKYRNTDKNIYEIMANDDIKDSYDGKMDIKSFEGSVMFFNKQQEAQIKKLLNIS